MIVLGDADVDYAVKAAAFGIFFHQGQVCMANSRILVEEPIFDAFCERFAAVAKSLKVGDPREPDTVIGPLIRGTQCAVIDGHVEDAVNKGAKLMCGTTHKDQYYWPTVLSGVTPDSPAARAGVRPESWPSPWRLACNGRGPWPPASGRPR